MSLPFPSTAAFNLAKKMKEFRAKTEEAARSENNQYAESDRIEVVRQIDWNAFNDVINQLEFTELHILKYGRGKR